MDDVAAQVEARHYPGQPPAREQPLWEAGLDGLRLLAVTIGLNLLFLPVFLVLMFLPPLNLVFFYLLNGHLIGREYFELVAVRRMSSEEARALRKHYKARVFSAGVIIAILLTISVSLSPAAILWPTWRLRL